MQIELSAKELAYVTCVVKMAEEHDVGIEVTNILYEACMNDVQAATYLFGFEKELEKRSNG